MVVDQSEDEPPANLEDGEARQPLGEETVGGDALGFTEAGRGRYTCDDGVGDETVGYWEGEKLGSPDGDDVEAELVGRPMGVLCDKPGECKGTLEEPREAVGRCEPARGILVILGVTSMVYKGFTHCF